MFRHRLSAAATVMGLLGWAAVASAAMTYMVTDLVPASGDTRCYAYGLNNQGDVVGESDGSGYRPVVWRNGIPTTLSYNNGTSGQINDFGVAAGTTNTGTPESMRAFSWSQSQGLHGVGSAPSTTTAASSINNNGVIAGLAYSGASYYAITWVNGTPAPVTPLSGRKGQALDINDAGQLSAEAMSDSGQMHAWRVSGNQATDLGALWTAGESRGMAISPTGQVVGDGFFADGSYHAVLFGDTEAKDLGTLGGSGSGARDMSADGTIIGWANINSTSTMHAFIYRSGVMTDLNDYIDPSSGWVLNVAYRMNDLGQIAGSGTINGQYHGFLLTPVPEPTMLAVAVIAVAVLHRRHRIA